MQSMNYCKVKYFRQTKTYIIGMERYISYLSHVNFKFDTGATDTMITINALFTNTQMAKKAVWFLSNCYKFVAKTHRLAYGMKATNFLLDFRIE